MLWVIVLDETGIGMEQQTQVLGLTGNNTGNGTHNISFSGQRSNTLSHNGQGLTIFEMRILETENVL